jgi:hypothetical protein
LACRAGNTARITYQDMTWTESFDSFAIYFSHSKTDQLGEEAKYPRHVYSNPLVPLICPILSLSVYFSSCFNTQQQPNGKIFPGNGQASRFSTILARVINDNGGAVYRMGYEPGVLGTHSIRKGAVSYLASLPGGPPAASTCIRSGWTMGKVKDIYMRYVVSGDQFVGRCLTLLSVLCTEFAVSPVHFVSEEYDWIEPSRQLQFPMVGKVVGFEKMTRMCLAAVIYHHGWLSSVLHVNHVFLQSSYIHRTQEILGRRDECVTVAYPWEDNNFAFTGVPPHTAILQELTAIKQNQRALMGEFVIEVTTVLNNMGIDGGRMTEQHLRHVLQELQTTFLQQLQQQNITVVGAEPANVAVNDHLNAPEAGRNYMSHVYNGKFNRVPKDWRIPRCGIFDLWRQLLKLEFLFS